MNWFRRSFPRSWKSHESVRHSAGLGCDCHAINLACGSVAPEHRVRDFGVAAPNCICESQTTSPNSPRPVSNTESLTRFIFSPIHISRKNGKVLPAAFSHVATKGCSVQRESVATDAELTQWIGGYSQKNPLHIWKGTLVSTCQSLREIQLSDKTIRTVAVYDTAEPGNPAHAEIFQTEHVIDDADRIELRAEVLKCFSNGNLTEPTAYRANALCSI